MQTKYLMGAAALALCALLLYKQTHHTPVQDNALIVGTNAEYQPFCFVQDGIITGFDIDIIQELAQRMEKPIQIQDMSFTALIPALQLGSVHVVAAGLTPTPERAQEVFFLPSHYAGDPLVLISKNKNSYTALQELVGKAVLVNEGFTSDSYATQHGNLDIERTATVADAFTLLNNDRVDAYLAAQSAVKPFFDQHGIQDWHVSTIEGTQESCAIAVSKEHPALHAQLQQHLNDMLADGTIAKLQKKWGLA